MDICSCQQLLLQLVNLLEGQRTVLPELRSCLLQGERVIGTGGLEGAIVRVNSAKDTCWIEVPALKRTYKAQKRSALLTCLEVQAETPAKKLKRRPAAS